MGLYKTASEQSLIEKGIKEGKEMMRGIDTEDCFVLNGKSVSREEFEKEMERRRNGT